MNQESTVQAFTEHSNLAFYALLAIIIFTAVILLILRLANKSVFNKLVRPVLLIALVLSAFSIYKIYSLKKTDGIVVSGPPFYKKTYNMMNPIRPSTFGFDDGGMGDHPVDMYIAGLGKGKVIYQSPEELAKLLKERKDQPLAEISYQTRFEKKEPGIDGDKNKIVTEKVTKTVSADDLKNLELLDKYFETLSIFERDLEAYIEKK